MSGCPLLAVFSLSQPTKNEPGWTLESIPETTLAKSQVASSRAGLSPTVGAGLSGSRGEGGDSTTNTTSSGVKNSVSATLAASWESDLWGDRVEPSDGPAIRCLAGWGAAVHQLQRSQ